MDFYYIKKKENCIYHSYIFVESYSLCDPQFVKSQVNINLREYIYYF